ncbi:hypothetical protein F4859DRAFT_464461 [Xylaria cf. heliscus]|nr:hypothetical protein F4859DRAFT_464461 [Xylaria cf. heliscus]
MSGTGNRLRWPRVQWSWDSSILPTLLYVVFVIHVFWCFDGTTWSIGVASFINFLFQDFFLFLGHPCTLQSTVHPAFRIAPQLNLQWYNCTCSVRSDNL